MQPYVTLFFLGSEETWTDKPLHKSEFWRIAEIKGRPENFHFKRKRGEGGYSIRGRSEKFHFLWGGAFPMRGSSIFLDEVHTPVYPLIGILRRQYQTYPKHTTFSVYIFLHISRILVDFGKLNTHEIFFWTTFAKINTRQICTKIIFRENK